MNSSIATSRSAALRRVLRTTIDRRQLLAFSLWQIAAAANTERSDFDVAFAERDEARSQADRLRVLLREARTRLASERDQNAKLKASQSQKSVPVKGLLTQVATLQRRLQQEQAARATEQKRREVAERRSSGMMMASSSSAAAAAVRTPAAPPPPPAAPLPTPPAHTPPSLISFTPPGQQPAPQPEPPQPPMQQPAAMVEEEPAADDDDGFDLDLSLVADAATPPLPHGAQRPSSLRQWAAAWEHEQIAWEEQALQQASSFGGRQQASSASGATTAGGRDKFSASTTPKGRTPLSSTLPPKTPLQVEPSSSARAGPSSSSSSSFVAAAPATSLTTPAAAAGSSPLLAAKARVAQILAEVGLGASTDEVWAEASRTVAQGGSSAHGV